MMAEIHKQALDAGLSPLLTRIAVILSDIDGDDRATAFIKSVGDELVHPAAEHDAGSLSRSQQIRVLEV